MFIKVITVTTYNFITYYNYLIIEMISVLIRVFVICLVFIDFVIPVFLNCFTI